MTLKELQKDNNVQFYNEPRIYGLDVHDSIELLGTYYDDIDDKVIIRKNNKITLSKIYYTPTDKAYFISRTKRYYVKDFIPKLLK